VVGKRLYYKLAEDNKAPSPLHINPPRHKRRYRLGRNAFG
jgi:hypothetical protein